MNLTKLKLLAGLVATCGVLTASGVWAVGQGAGGGEAPAAGAPGGAPPVVKAAEKRAGAAQRLRSMNNLKQIMLAMHNYESAYGHFPTDITDKKGKPLLSWRVAILPFIEQEALHRAFKLDEPWDSEHNKKWSAVVVKIFQCGAEPKDQPGSTFYKVFTGPGTAYAPPAPGGAGGGEGGAGGPGGAAGFGGTPATAPAGSPGAPGAVPAAPGGAPADPAAGPGGIGGGAAGGAQPTGPRIVSITDGTSNTLGVVEAGPAVPWAKPGTDIAYDPKKPLPKMDGPFTTAMHVATFDGAVYSLKRGLDENVMRGIIECQDGLVTPPLQKLQSELPATTEEEKAELRKMIVENEIQISVFEKQMQEYLKLHRLRAKYSSDLLKAAEHGEELLRMVDGIKAMNKKLRDELGIREGAAILKD